VNFAADDYNDDDESLRPADRGRAAVACIREGLGTIQFFDTIDEAVDALERRCPYDLCRFHHSILARDDTGRIRVRSRRRPTPPQRLPYGRPLAELGATLLPATATNDVAATATPADEIPTRCRHGHEYSEENTYWRQGRRYCRACHRENMKAYHARKATASATPVATTPPPRACYRGHELPKVRIQGERCEQCQQRNRRRKKRNR
jgi:hypothetical protein